MNKKLDLGRFKKRKKANYSKALLLILVLLAIVYLYNNSEIFLQRFMGE